MFFDYVSHSQADLIVHTPWLDHALAKQYVPHYVEFQW